MFRSGALLTWFLRMAWSWARVTGYDDNVCILSLSSVLSCRVCPTRSSRTASFCRLALSSVLLSVRECRSEIRETLPLNCAMLSCMDVTYRAEVTFSTPRAYNASR